MPPKKNKQKKTVATIRHAEDKRTYIPTAEFESILADQEKDPLQAAYERRNRDLDPQLVWRGKDELSWSDLVVPAPPLFIQEKVKPKVLIDDLMQQTRMQITHPDEHQLDLYADFNGLPDGVQSTDFYQHDANWTNRMILGDSLQVMASLAEREGIRGEVQCIYFDPPYGIQFNSNFQWSTTSRDVKDGKFDHITREPEQVKAFRDTWRDGIHSYLTYLRDRLTVARDLLSESGSIFVQIGHDNVHRVRVVLDEVFGPDNFVAQVTFRVKSPLAISQLARTTDFILWYGRSVDRLKFRQLRVPKKLEEHPEFTRALLPNGRVLPRRKAQKLPDQTGIRYFTAQNLASSGYTTSCMYDFVIHGRTFTHPKGKSWKTTETGMRRLQRARRLEPLKTSLRWRYYHDDAPSEVVKDVWLDTFAATNKQYVVQTAESVVQRCLLMTTDPGDLILDPTCGSGTSAFVAEKWGRRWITVDTSRVALALARSRIMGSRFEYYLLADSPEGRLKQAAITGGVPSTAPTYGSIRQGFVHERVPRITLRSIANNAAIDEIWEKYEKQLEGLRGELNRLLDEEWEAWEVPNKPGDAWPEKAKLVFAELQNTTNARQSEVDASITAQADFDVLIDRPYTDASKIRVAGPFTVESLSPHRGLVISEEDDFVNPVGLGQDTPGFAETVLENLRAAGVQQSQVDDKIVFSSLNGWPGELICAEGRYSVCSEDSVVERRAGVFIGPEFGTVSRRDLVAAAREAADAGFELLITCAFSYDAHSADLDKWARLPVLKARMNADLHMANDLKTTGKGNLFVVFGEPDIEILIGDQTASSADQIQVRINGVDVFHPQTGEIRSDGPEGIACWFIDTDYNGESFFVRHAYFLGAEDPFKALKASLKAEIDREAWESLHSNTSRPFRRPSSGRIAVKVINHLGDEVMKVFRV